MAQKNKICLGCTRRFDGRRDAKTCSARCRKRLQRAKGAYSLTESWFYRAQSPLERQAVTHFKNGGNDGKR